MGVSANRPVFDRKTRANVKADRTGDNFILPVNRFAVFSS